MEAVAVVVPVGALEQAQDQDRGQTQDQANIMARAQMRAQMQAQARVMAQAQARVMDRDRVEAMGLETARVTTELARLMAQVTDPGSLPIRIRNFFQNPAFIQNSKRGRYGPFFIARYPDSFRENLH